MAKKYSLSKAAVLDILQKLKIEKGDVLVVKDIETLEYLSKVHVPGIEGTVPLVYAPQGVQVLKREDLLNLLEQLEQADKSVLEPYGLTEQPNAPL